LCFLESVLELDGLQHLRDDARPPCESDVLILEERFHIALPVGCVEACGCVGEIRKHRIARKSRNHSIIVLLEVIVSERPGIDVAGQTVTFPTGKVRAIYFEAARPTQSSGGGEADALRAVKNLGAATQAGVTYQDYSARVATANGVVAQFVESGGANPSAVGERVGEAMRFYVLATRAWSARLQRQGTLDLRDDPLIIPCLLAKNAVYEPDTRDPGPLRFATQDALWGAQQAFWACASDKVAEAEQLSRR